MALNETAKLSLRKVAHKTKEDLMSPEIFYISQTRDEVNVLYKIYFLYGSNGFAGLPEVDFFFFFKKAGTSNYELYNRPRF